MEPAQSDETRRRALLDAIRQQGGIDPSPAQSPVVSLEDFFEGNADMGSIGCNLIRHPGVAAFYRALKQNREHPDVQNVLVGIREVEETEGVWPFSDSIYILTSLSNRKVARWLKRLQPDEVGDVPADWQPERLPEPLPGYRTLLAWWD
jgi:hypothetical protein